MSSTNQSTISFSKEINWVYPAPSVHWKKFFAQFPEIIHLPLEKWREIHCLAFFACKYQEYYDQNFAFSFKGSPTRCTEMVLVKKILTALGEYETKDFVQYISWVFESRVKSKNLHIRSLGFFLSSDLINEFLYKRKLGKLGLGNNSITLTRASQLPDNYRQIISQYGFEASTYGDVAFLKQYASSNEDEKAQQALQQLISSGLQVSMLEELR